METKKMYKWVCESNISYFTDESKEVFESKEDCYNDMRDAALKKMKWNGEYICNVAYSSFLDYEVRFNRNKIILKNYNGEGVYEIVEVNVNIQTNNPTTTKIVYVLPIGENEEYAKLLAKEFTREEFENLLVNNADVRIYDTMEDFAKAFNNRYISDLGYMCIITIKN